MTPNPSPPVPCSEYETACLQKAWEIADDPDFAAHRATCPRCREALATTEEFVALCRVGGEQAPDRVRRGLSEAVFERTTRQLTATPRARWVWTGVGAGLATAVVAFLTLRPSTDSVPVEAVDLAEVDLELLEHLELAENLEILEVLEALEALGDV